MTTRHARCSCGQLQAETTGDPVRVSVCHCHACQLRTGSVFGAQARFAKSAVTVTGRTSQYVRIGDSGQKITFYFCPDCGSTVYYQLENAPEMIAIPVGAFADSGFPAPQYSVYESRRHSWAGLPPGITGAD
jgi:hypothetical protein